MSLKHPNHNLAWRKFRKQVWLVKKYYNNKPQSYIKRLKGCHTTSSDKLLCLTALDNY